MPGSSIAKRSIVFNGKKTSVSLEDEFWNAMKEIAGKRAIHLSDLVSEIDDRRGHGNLSSALRLFVLTTIKSRHRTPSDGLGPHSWPPQFVARRAKIPWRRRSLGFRLSVVEIWHLRGVDHGWGRHGYIRSTADRSVTLAGQPLEPNPVHKRDVTTVVSD